MTGNLTLAQYHALQAETFPERDLQNVITAEAQRRGYLVYHTHDSRRSQPGYPDLHLLHPTTHRQLFRELKTQKGRTTPEQKEWLMALVGAGVDAKVWRPIDWFNGTISRELDEVTS